MCNHHNPQFQRPSSTACRLPESSQLAAGNEEHEPQPQEGHLLVNSSRHILNVFCFVLYTTVVMVSLDTSFNFTSNSSTRLTTECTFLLGEEKKSDKEVSWPLIHFLTLYIHFVFQNGTEWHFGTFWDTLWDRVTINCLQVCYSYQGGFINSFQSVEIQCIQHWVSAGFTINQG